MSSNKNSWCFAFVAGPDLIGAAYGISSVLTGGQSAGEKIPQVCPFHTGYRFVSPRLSYSWLCSLSSSAFSRPPPNPNNGLRDSLDPQ